ncbi:hypothetical protein [Nocardiopsis sp. HUAS JQ3]|uniref:hypothetical protein n=1 Tax=Nocardiopsis sp. HUAS JQ3 TaxID=3061629 RepID=UPI0023AA0B17|nr:hypothetical protein [Nocardiopsis sp. HUAS JQ3]WDZ93426.1 hypothetical protein PV789_13180 [Nocardiopsis sp. HUAS JQ3]
MIRRLLAAAAAALAAVAALALGAPAYADYHATDHPGGGGIGDPVGGITVPGGGMGDPV